VAQLELKIMALDRLPTLNGLQFMRAANNRGRDRPVKTGGWVVQQPGWCSGVVQQPSWQSESGMSNP